MRVSKKGDGESPTSSNCLDDVALLKPTAVQPKCSSRIAVMSIGKVPLDLDSLVDASEDITSDSLSSQRLEPIADLQHEEEEFKGYG